MGKKKQEKVIPRRWMQNQTNSLLAWLDHTLKHPEINFEATIVKHLDNEYTLEQIDRKLKWCWKTWGPWPKKDINGPKDIYKLGTSCLVDQGFTNTIQEAIATCRNAIDREATTRQEREVLVTPQRQLRSLSRADSPGTLRKSGLSTPSGRDGRSATIGPLQRSLTPTTPKDRKRNRIEQHPNPCSIHLHIANKNRSDTASGSTSTWPDSGKKKGAGNLIVIHDSASQVKTQIMPKMEEKHMKHRKKRHISSSGVIKNGGREELEEDNTMCSICGLSEAPDGEDGGWVACDRCAVWDHVSCIKYYCGTCAPVPSALDLNTPALSTTAYDNASLGTDVSTQTDSFHTLDRKLASAKSKIEQMGCAIIEKDNLIDDCRREVEESNRKLAQLKVARAQVSESSGETIEDVIVGLKAKLHKLEKEADLRFHLGIFSKLRLASRERFGETQMVHGFIDIFSHSKQLLCRQDGKILGHLPSLSTYRDLNDLVAGLAARSEKDVVLTGEMMSVISQASPQAAIRALTASAVRGWVFQSKCPDFEPNASDVLHGYRENIMRQGGVLALRNLDLAVLDSLIKSKDFREVTVPERATAMAIRLTQVLAPLFSDTPGNPEEEEYDGFATWRHDEEECRERRHRLVDLFTAALKTKADSCLNIEQYEMVIFPPGTKFNPQTMNAETMEGMVDTTKKYDDRRVLLCVEAAVFTYARELREDASISEAIVSTNNFVTKEEGRRGKVRPLMKAVVILS